MKKAEMRPAHVVEIVTPKKFLLNGLWFGSSKAKRTIVWVHGLGGSIFSKLKIADELVDGSTAVLVFNNRGHDTITKVGTTGKKRIRGGASHEKFTDCADDIQGAINFARRRGIKNIFLVGHSTGCQKSIYWAVKGGKGGNGRKGKKGVKGIILLAPVSDWAAEMKLKGNRILARAASAARALIRRGEPHQLLPTEIWDTPIDAQRFISLYTPNSAEEIFSYAQPRKYPRTLKLVRIPVLVLWAAKDEFADRPAKEIAAWFRQHLQNGEIEIIPRASHGFKGAERNVAREIQRFIKSS